MTDEIKLLTYWLEAAQQNTCVVPANELREVLDRIVALEKENAELMDRLTEIAKLCGPLCSTLEYVPPWHEKQIRAIASIATQEPSRSAFDKEMGR